MSNRATGHARGTTRRSLVTLSSGVALTGLVLSGCGVDRFAQAGSTADVDVTHSDLQGAYAEFEELRPALQGEAVPGLGTVQQPDLLTLLLIGPEVDRVYRAEPPALPEGAVVPGADELLVELQRTSGVSSEVELTSFDPLVIDATDTYLQLLLLTDPAAVQVGPSQITVPILAEHVLGGRDINPEDINVNPRYGEWDPEAAAIVQVEPEWINTEDADAATGR